MKQNCRRLPDNVAVCGSFANGIYSELGSDYYHLTYTPFSLLYATGINFLRT